MKIHNRASSKKGVAYKKKVLKYPREAQYSLGDIS